jgi:DNA-binding transcriptional LysR family regulator|tara:strand:+ start:926 stop:1816 length:891 start_codon:yes stop_codon:yes gene_type:complete
MDWDKLKIFHAVAEAGSFTNATTILNITQSAISRQIQSLEQDLNVQLFERHARGLTLTENGEYVYKTAHEVICKLKEVETSLGDQKNKPSGKLTITTVRSFGTHWLTPRIQEFMNLNPEIEIELIFDDKELDLSTRQADIGIFMRRPKQLNYIQRKLVDINYHIYGSTKYLEKYGIPKTTNDLNKHRFISFGKGAPSPVFNPDWALKLGNKDNKKRKPIMKVNSIMGLLLAVESGVGLAALPDYLVSQSQNVIKVLPKLEGPITEAHFVYPQSLKNVARVQAFRNFLYSKLSETKF